MRAKILSDGRRSGTKLVDAETGERLELPGYVCGLEWKTLPLESSEGEPVVVLYLKGRDVELDVEAQVEDVVQGKAPREVDVRLPERKWRDMLYCLGPHGFGWGQYSVEDSYLEGFKDALTAIEAAVGDG